MNPEIESEVNFAQVITDQMQDAAIVVNSEQQIIYVNQKLADILPDPDAVIGANAIPAIEKMATDATAVEQYATALEAVLTDGDERSVATPVLLPPGERMLDLRMTPYRHDGDIVGAVIIARDITERDQLKDHLLYLNQLLRHDIRNDLTIINGYAELIAENLSEQDEELESIISASEHGIELTQTARDFIKSITEEDSQSDLVPVEIKETIVSETEQVRLMYPEADISIASDLPTVSVQANELLDSVVRNLLTNAVQHNTNPNPSVEISLLESPEFVELRVADNGPGISDAQKSKIFNQQHKGSESTGSGIGLYLVQQVVETYSGDVWVSENDPTGAIFHVKLPK